MSVVNIAFSGFVLYFIVRAILAPNWRSSGGRRGRLDAFSKDAGKLDCIILAALMLIGLLIGLFV